MFWRDPHAEAWDRMDTSDLDVARPLQPHPDSCRRYADALISLSRWPHARGGDVLVPLNGDSLMMFAGRDHGRRGSTRLESGVS